MGDKFYFGDDTVAYIFEAKNTFVVCLSKDILKPIDLDGKSGNECWQMY